MRAIPDWAILARFLDLISRAWLRKRKFESLLTAFPFDFFVDAGANRGEFSVVAAKKIGFSNVLCIEPHPDCAHLLRKNGFDVKEAALWIEECEKPFMLAQESTQSALVNTQAIVPTILVKCITLDSLGIQSSQVLLKLDLQGADVDIILHSALFLRQVNGLIFECPLSVDPRLERLDSFLTGEGFIEYLSLNDREEKGRIVERDRVWIRKTLLV